MALKKKVLAIMGISQLLPPLQGHTMFHFKSTHDDEKKEDAYETTVPVSVSPPQSALQQEIHHHNNRPWYAAGGMDVNMIGIGINISAPVIFLACDLTDDYRKLFLCFLLCMYTAAALTSHTLYCIIVVPTFMSSLLLVLAVSRHHPAIVMTVTIILAIAKVNICMSVCLHRYASHAAFKCGPVAHLFLSVMACLANQGGPLWWASQHRCHHKYCDLPRDPHSPIQVGTEVAFGFFQIRTAVEEEFVPRHMEAVLMRILDTWASAVVTLELAAAYYFFGREGLFIAFTSGWICQSITLWFNIANHPPNDAASDKDKLCKASDGQAPVSNTLYLPFYVLDALYPLFAVFVMEGEHELHHLHPTLAKRSASDIAYWTFIKPLEMLGLVWNVVL